MLSVEECVCFWLRMNSWLCKNNFSLLSCVFEVITLKTCTWIWICGCYVDVFMRDCTLIYSDCVVRRVGGLILSVVMWSFVTLGNCFSPVIEQKAGAFLMKNSITDELFFQHHSLNLPVQVHRSAVSHWQTFVHSSGCVINDDVDLIWPRGTKSQSWMRGARGHSTASQSTWLIVPSLWLGSGMGKKIAVGIKWSTFRLDLENTVHYWDYKLV